MISKNLILTLAAVAALVLSASAIINSGLLKNKTSKTNQSTSTQSSKPIDPRGPVDGTFNFVGNLSSVRPVSGGTEIVIEVKVGPEKVEKKTFLITSSARVTEGPEGATTRPSSVSNLQAGQYVYIEATLVAKTEAWTVNLVQIVR